MTQKTVAIYVITKGLNEVGCIDYAVSAYAQAFDEVIVVHEGDGEVAPLLEPLKAYDNVSTMPFAGQVFTPLAGYKTALDGLAADRGALSALLLTGSHVFGPIHGVDPAIFSMQADGVDVLSSYWHNGEIDPRLKGDDKQPQVPYLDHVAFGPAVLGSDSFWGFWSKLRPEADFWQEFLQGALALGKQLIAEGRSIVYPMEASALETFDPRLFEVHKVVTHGAPCLPVAVLFLDPLLHDLNAIDLRGALDGLRAANPELYGHVIRFATRNVQMREFNTIADQYEVIGDYAADPDKTEWSFGPVAVFIHAFYADMMPEFWELIGRIPAERHLFITTATEENAVKIRAFLDDKGYPQAHFDVRVVEQNRGRDMSSLFITFRDVVMDQRYQVALRLHSKRTPQVSRQVGESFKEHLFDNLVQSPGQVRNILDMMEAEPDIGLVIPPVIHIGFGTLGHAWFNNKANLAKLAQEMDIDVPLDDSTPVGAYGTMYWFRPDAMWKMFAQEWKWDDYNPEPHHIDGGLAHVQERLIAYAVQDRGYRVKQIMNPRLAARYYAKLEYKLQLFCSFLGSNNVMDQKYEMETSRGGVRTGLYRRLRMAYGQILIRFPASRKFLRPFKETVVYMLMPRR